jgi:hypothetical protein
MLEGAVAASPIAGLLAMTGVALPVAGWTEAIAAVAGGAYEGGKYLLGGTAPVKQQGSDASGVWGAAPAGPGKESSAESTTQTVQVTTVLNVDSRRLAEAVTKHQVADGNGPAQGSPYPDTTRGGSSFDFALMP